VQPRILTVDDNREALLALQGILEREHMHVTPADNAEDGLDALSRAYFDLVITDFRMPRKSGLDLIMETRSHGVWVPFVLLTADADHTIHKRAKDIGFVAVLNKPVRKQSLLNQVSRVVSRPLQDNIPSSVLREHCTAKCIFSTGGFCSVLIRQAPEALNT